MTQRIILSGMRPTGKLHLGNVLGALSNWVKLQNESNTKCFYMVADWHALTTDYEETSQIESNISDMILDCLAQDLDPEKSVLFRQSWVPEHAELSLILSMITPLSWLERNPTYKEQMKELSGKEISTHGFLGYPVLQAADILLYRATHVPVGEDQLPHLELSREIARRFNFIYKKQIFIEPQAILSKSPKIPGTDGRKMSKSYNNCVYNTDEESVLKKKVQTLFTDPNKIRANDPGHPKPCPENPTGCIVYALHEQYELEPNKNIKREKDCKDGTLGCAKCKGELFETLNQSFKPIREKRIKLSQDPQLVNQILLKGSEQASKTAGETLILIKEAMGFKNPVAMAMK